MSATTRTWPPFRHWPRPDPKLLGSEFLAALTVTAVMVPQSVAYAGLAGMPLVTGLYASLLPALVAALFGSSTRLSVGPTALTCLLVGASLAGRAEPGSQEWATLAVWMAVIAGAAQMLIGLCRATWLLRLVSVPVLEGFSQAAALLIIASQLPDLLGIRSHAGLPGFGGSVDGYALAFGLGSLGAFMLGRRWMPRWPVMLLTILVAGILSRATGFEASGAVVGPLPSGLPLLMLPAWPGAGTVATLITPALVIALVSSLELAASAQIEAQRDARRWEAATDLVAQGMAKLAAALSASFPTSTSFSRSALTLYAGARTGWSALLSAAMVVAVLLWLMPALAAVPRAVLAAVVIVAVAGLLRPGTLRRFWQIDRTEAAVMAATFAATLVAAPRIHWGILTGILLASAYFMARRFHPRIVEVGLHPDGSLRDRAEWDLPTLAPDVLAVRMDAALDFSTADAFEATVLTRLDRAPQTRHLVLFCQGINRVDVTGARVLQQLIPRLRARFITLHLVGMKLPLERSLQAAGLLTPDPLLRLHRTDADALGALAHEEPA